MKASDCPLKPCDGLVPAIRRLRELGYEMHIVTASVMTKEEMTRWVEEAGLGVGPGKAFEAIHFTNRGPNEAAPTPAPIFANAEEEDRWRIEAMAKGIKDGTMAYRKLAVSIPFHLWSAYALKPSHRLCKGLVQQSLLMISITFSIPSSSRQMRSVYSLVITSGIRTMLILSILTTI
jgi:hypothetical protein